MRDSEYIRMRLIEGPAGASRPRSAGGLMQQLVARLLWRKSALDGGRDVQPTPGRSNHVPNGDQTIIAAPAGSAAGRRSTVA